MTAGESGLKTQVTNTYEFGTQRLANSRVDRENQPGVDRSASYRYDDPHPSSRPSLKREVAPQACGTTHIARQPEGPR